MKNWIIVKLGGYTDLDSFLESQDKLDRRYILTLLVKRLYNTIDSEDILKENDLGQWMMMGKSVTDVDKQLMIAEATQFQKTKLWEVLQKDIKYQANRKMYLLARDEMSITAGKLWIYILDSINTRLSNMSKGKGIPTKSDF